MIYVFLADGYEECEAFAPVDILRRAELDVATVKIIQGSGGELAVGSHNICVKADIHESEVDFGKTSVSMIVLPGGGIGVENLYNSPIIKEAVSHCVKNKLPIGAICAAPSILARWGHLKGKTATAYPSFKHYLSENGANLSEKKVVTDGIYTTAEAAGASLEFALELVTVIRGKEVSDKIAAQIVL